jgi:UDP-N-acetylmuramyl pentapeptide phosphotransferase/UDP-N-acetylglucosamine-1-phosphate transferase
MLVAVVVVSFLLAIVTVRLLLFRFARFALDHPNERSLHSHPVPRTGGVAVLAGTVAAFLFIGTQLWLPVLLALLLGVISLYDDIYHLPTRIRLTAHFGVTTLLAWYVLSPMNIPQFIAQFIALVLAVVWITNLYNFMDGADGIAGGMAVIGFGAYALAAWLSGHFALAALSAAIAAASLAFLTSNFHPARIFLGDVGSIPLGFLVGALGLIGWRDEVWPLWFPLLAFGPFMGDATITLLRRLARHERVWQPHRDHYYQRLVRLGFSHRDAALMGYLAMIFCAAMALVGRTQPPALQAAAFTTATLVLAAMGFWIDWRWRRMEGRA